MSALLETALAQVWRLSWQASALIALVLLAQWIGGRRWPARWRFNLWLLVVVRLALPWSLESPLSMYNVARWRTAPASLPAAPPMPLPAPPTAIVLQPAVEQTPAIELIDVPSKEELPVSTPPVSIQPAPARFEPPRLAAPLTTRRPFAWRSFLAPLWAAGALALAAQVAFTNGRMRRRLQDATPIDDPILLTLLEECRALMRVRSSLPLLETSAVQSPALFGFWRPRLLLPRGLAEKLSATETRHVFLHELAHVRRRDLPLNWLVTFLQVLHWFNPVIWFGLARMRADRELACDALVLEQQGDNEPCAYGRTIIKLLESAPQPSAVPGLVGILESKSQMARRIRMIAHFRGSKRWPLLAMGLTAALAIIGLTDAARQVRAETAKPAETGKTIRVSVVDAETGLPVPDAAVYTPFDPRWIVSERPVPLQTDREGIVLIPSAREGGLLVVHSDYAPACRTRNPYQSPSVPLADCTLKLARGEAIGGVVTDEAGRALAGVRVEIKGTSEPEGDDQKAAFFEHPVYPARYMPEVVTDANGRWSCPHFSIGVQMLQLNFHRGDGSFYSYHTKIPPGSSGMSGATTPISMDEARQQKLVSVLPDGTEVRGVARDTAGRPLAGVTVTERDHRHQKPVAELKTDANGRFSLPHRDPHQVLLTLTGDGLATAVRVLHLEPGLPEQVFTMTPAVSLRVRVVDEQGQPIKDAMIAPPELALGWTGKTDAQGLATWPAAPREPQSFTVSAENFDARILRLAPTEKETVVTLRATSVAGTQVVVKPLGEDGKPLAQFKVLIAYAQGIHSPFDKFVPLAEGRDGICAALVPSEKSQSDAFCLKVEAPGMLPYVSEPLHPFDGEPSLTPTLRAGRPLEGTVLLPDGTPAAGASVILTNTDGERSSINLIFFSGGSIRVEARNSKPVRTGEDGKFSLPMALAKTPVLFIHGKGTLTTTAGELAQMSEVRLVPWGSVEGKYTINGVPQKGKRINLQPQYDPQRAYTIMSTTTEETDHEGNFRINPAPLGLCVISGTQLSEGQWPRSYSTAVTVQSGVVTHIDCAGRGGKVTGQVRLLSPAAELDWPKELGTALLSEARADAEYYMPSYYDFVQQRDYMEAHGRPRMRSQGFTSSYPLQFEADGSFHADGIPPGRYRLELMAYRREPGQRNMGKEIGGMSQEVVVPPQSEGATADLGAFILPLTEEAAPRKSPVSLSARTLAGQPVALADHLGKQVLLLFWATWAPPSAEMLAQWKRLYEAHGTDPKFVMLGISLDDDPAVAQKFADAQEWHWPQARLEGGQKAVATENLEVDALPSALLIGPDGRVVARDANEARLRTLIEKFLTPAK